MRPMRMPSAPSTTGLPARARRGLAALLASALLLSASPALAAWEFPSLNYEGSRAEEVVATGVDLLLVRPLATARVAVGALIFVPAVILSSPGGRENFDGAYELLIEEPVDYAFNRKIAEF